MVVLSQDYREEACLFGGDVIVWRGSSVLRTSHQHDHVVEDDADVVSCFARSHSEKCSSGIQPRRATITATT